MKKTTRKCPICGIESQSHEAKHDISTCIDNLIVRATTAEKALSQEKHRSARWKLDAEILAGELHNFIDGKPPRDMWLRRHDEMFIQDEKDFT